MEHFEKYRDNGEQTGRKQSITILKYYKFIMIKRILQAHEQISKLNIFKVINMLKAYVDIIQDYDSVT